MARTPQPAGPYTRVTSRLYGSLASSRTPASAELRDELLRRIADGMIGACEAAETADDAAVRLDQTLTALAGEGLAYEIRDSDGAVSLRRADCRWSRLVGDSAGAVVQEKRILATLLGVDETQIVHDGMKFVYLAAQTSLQGQT